MIKIQEVYTPHSHNLKKELRNYAWSDKKAGIPKDKDNHGLDATRYAFLQLAEPIRNNLNAIASLI